MRIPIREQGSGNIIRYEDIPIIPNQVIDFNRTKETRPEYVVPNERAIPAMIKDINLGVTRIVPTEENYFKGRKPTNVL